MANPERLHQPFQRTDPASQFTETGMGPSIVRRVVRYHGREVRVRSGLGVGTVVEFRLEAPPGSGAQNTP
jgi:signal transduction histidine kinase